VPNYDYECPRCGRFELQQSIKDAPIKRCPTCRCKVKRIIVAAGGFKMVQESSTRYQQWYHSDATQAKIASGELVHASKSSDVRQ
jgi:putative FmdB family regulatory protein